MTFNVAAHVIILPPQFHGLLCHDLTFSVFQQTEPDWKLSMP